MKQLLGADIATDTHVQKGDDAASSRLIVMRYPSVEEAANRTLKEVYHIEEEK